MQIPTDRDVHTTSLKVRFYELDPYDHVNHTVYFSYFETARIEYLRDSGFGLDQMKKEGWQLVLVEANARFLAAARYGRGVDDPYLGHRDRSCEIGMGTGDVSWRRRGGTPSCHGRIHRLGREATSGA